MLFAVKVLYFGLGFAVPLEASLHRAVQPCWRGRQDCSGGEQERPSEGKNGRTASCQGDLILYTFTWLCIVIMTVQYSLQVFANSLGCLSYVETSAVMEETAKVPFVTLISALLDLDGLPEEEEETKAKSGVNLIKMSYYSPWFSARI